ncbi:MAG: metallophosphoesterase [Deltaproteobacteria bacterium]
MAKEDFPVVISPNLGCPIIVSLDELRDPQRPSIPLIIASQDGPGAAPLKSRFDDSLRIRPCYMVEGLPEEIKLNVQGDPVELKDWSTLSAFNSAHDTRLLINKEVHYNVLGAQTSYWKVDVSPDMDPDRYHSLLRQYNGKPLPTLYDVVLTSEHRGIERANRHSLQFVTDFSSGCAFAHVTDLHIATRNDHMLDEVIVTRHRRDRERIEATYINFNDNFRRFIREANAMADRGELDFVVISGDLVDFAFHGWEDSPNEAENNWKTFVNILTGSGSHERRCGNPGLRVAAFTSTGNHDWRPRPYNPDLPGIHKRFGLTKEELGAYHYKSFDASRYNKRRARLAQQMIRSQFDSFDLDVFTDNYILKLARLMTSESGQWLLPPIAGALGISGAQFAGLFRNWTNFARFGIYGAVGATLFAGTKSITDWLVRERIKLIMDNPLYADPMALNYYLKHVNPYLDYAFCWGQHAFIVMDTGADVICGSFQDKKGLKNLKKLSFVGHILGGSPDSLAFDSEHTHYNWSQIVWLEKALAALNPVVSPQGETTDARGERTVLFLHAPPVNVPYDIQYVRDHLWESGRNGTTTPWISKREHNLTFGTINHYVSQFFYLCLGFRESDISSGNAEKVCGRVDLVFSGHTHRNIEFRIDKDEEQRIRIYADPYSERLAAGQAGPGEAESWWQDHRPVMVQTAACGFRGMHDHHPPYYRRVVIGPEGEISEFGVRNLKGPVIFEKLKERTATQ